MSYKRNENTGSQNNKQDFVCMSTGDGNVYAHCRMVPNGIYDPDTYEPIVGDIDMRQRVGTIATVRWESTQHRYNFEL